jgi:hypothetical protein
VGLSRLLQFSGLFVAVICPAINLTLAPFALILKMLGRGLRLDASEKEVRYEVKKRGAPYCQAKRAETELRSTSFTSN